MLYLVHCHRKLLYFNVSIMYIIYIFVDIAKNPLKTFLGLNRTKKKNIKASPKKRSSYEKKGVVYSSAWQYMDEDVKIRKVRSRWTKCTSLELVVLITYFVSNHSLHTRFMSL